MMNVIMINNNPNAINTNEPNTDVSYNANPAIISIRPSTNTNNFLYIVFISFTSSRKFYTPIIQQNER